MVVSSTFLYEGNMGTIVPSFLWPASASVLFLPAAFCRAGCRKITVYFDH